MKMWVWFVEVQYPGGGYVVSAHRSDTSALESADALNRESEEVRRAAKQWRDSGYVGDEPDDLELEELHFRVAGVELEDD